MSPAVLLGPKCNHDLGILLRLAIDQRPEDPSADKQAKHAVSAMLEAMGDHEFYCSCYSSKEAPQIDGLLVTFADALDAKTREIAAA